MRRFSILLAPLLLLAGYAVGRFAATPAPFVAAQITTPAGEFRTEAVQVATPATQPRSAPLQSPRQVFRDSEDQLPVASAVVAQAKPAADRLPTVSEDLSNPFGESPQASSKSAAPPQLDTSRSDDFGFEAPGQKSPPAFIPTPIAAQTGQEEKYLNAALKVFRGLGETERQAEFAQMIGRMEEQDAAAELLRLRTELQQLSEKYPKTGAGKKALEAIQTLPVVDVPESESPASAAPPALPRPLESDSIFIPDSEGE